MENYRGTVIYAVTDGTANMMNGIDLAFGKRNHICFDHLLSLIVAQAFEQVLEITDTIK